MAEDDLKQAHAYLAAARARLGDGPADCPYGDMYWAVSNLAWTIEHMLTALAASPGEEGGDAD